MAEKIEGAMKKKPDELQRDLFKTDEELNEEQKEKERLKKLKIKKEEQKEANREYRRKIRRGEIPTNPKRKSNPDWWKEY